MLSGNNGILQRATDAKTKTDEAQIRERIQLAYHSALTKDITGENGELTKTTLQEELDNEFKDKTATITPNEDNTQWVIKVDDVEVTVTAGSTTLPKSAEGQIAGTQIQAPASYGENSIAVADGNDYFFALPNGFYYVGGTVNTGVVISDVEGDSMTEGTGNQFVWIPIPVTATNDLYVNGTTKPMARLSTGETNGLPNYEGVLYNFLGTSSTEMENYGQNTTSYREPSLFGDEENKGYIDWVASQGITASIPTANELQEEYNKMIVSVKKYGRFYVGRYELGLGDDNYSKRNVTAASTRDDETKSWYGLYAKSKGYEKLSITSQMIWGSQYDAMLNFALTNVNENSKVTATGHGNHSEYPTNTEIYGTDSINNIINLEGNMYELTQEATSTFTRVARGGYDGYYTPSTRNETDNGPLTSNYYRGSRISMYIN